MGTLRQDAKKAMNGVDKVLDFITPKPKVIASSAPPKGQCVGCGKRIKRDHLHCGKPACVKKAVRWE